MNKNQRIALAGAAGGMLGLLLAGATTVRAQLAPPPPEPKTPAFQVAKVNAYTWVGRFGNTNCSWIDMGDGVLVIDTSETPADGGNLAAQIKETTGGKPIKWFAMTHLHGDSNGGFVSFLPTDATVFMNERSVDYFAAGLATRAGKIPVLVGVSGRTTVAGRGRRVHLLAPAGSAHTSADLVVYHEESQIAFVGDLVITGHCPQLSDPACDPRSWREFLGVVAGEHPGVLVPTRMSPTSNVAVELEKTRTYLQRATDLLLEFKAKEYPEARVGSELRIQGVGEYCPLKVDSINLIGLYKRLQADGTFSQPAPTAFPTKPRSN